MSAMKSEFDCFPSPISSPMDGSQYMPCGTEHCPVEMNNYQVEQYQPESHQFTSPYLNIPTTKWCVQQPMSISAFPTVSNDEPLPNQPVHELCLFCIRQLQEMNANVIFKNSNDVAEPSYFKTKKRKNSQVVSERLAQIYAPKDQTLLAQFNLLDREERLRTMRTFFTHSKILTTAIKNMCQLDRHGKGERIKKFLDGELEHPQFEKRITGLYLKLRYEPEILKTLWRRFTVARFLSHLMDEHHNPTWTICPNLDVPGKECDCLSQFPTGDWRADSSSTSSTSIASTSPSTPTMSSSFVFVPVGPIVTI